MTEVTKFEVVEDHEPACTDGQPAGRTDAADDATVRPSEAELLAAVERQ